MINTAPLIHMWHNFLMLLGAGCGSILGAAIGLPLRRAIIRKYARKN